MDTDNITLLITHFRSEIHTILNTLSRMLTPYYTAPDTYLTIDILDIHISYP